MLQKKPKFFITTTIPATLPFFKGQPSLWNNKFDVCAISSGGKVFESFIKEEGIKGHIIDMKREISIFHDLWSFVLFVFYFLKERPLIVHGNTPKASMLSMVAACLTRRPIRIYMCQGLRYQTTKGLLRHVLMGMEKLTCSCATIVIPVSEGVRKQLISDGLCKAKKLQVVGYGTSGGIDLSYFSLPLANDTSFVRNRLNIKEDDFVFIFVGRVVRDKGVNELAAAFQRLSQNYSNVHLIIVGRSESERDAIDNKSNKIINDNLKIHAVGFQSDIRPYLLASNALVLPSYREGVGMVLLEANAMGIPCIASNIIGCSDVITPLVNGELIAPQNINILYDKMKEWIEHPEVVQSMSQKCREYVKERFSHVVVRDAYYHLYCKLAAV